MRQIPDYKKKEIDISNFKCVRLKYIRNQIKPQIRDFLCEKNYGLGQYLHYHAWPEELENYRAFYVVMDDEEIVMYFSLQMGSTIRCKKKRIGGVFYDSKTKTHFIDTDKLEVEKCIPTIEIPQFCVNDRYRNKRKNWTVNYLGREYTVGEYVFYYYIAPMVIQSAETVGFQYLILFCADNNNGTLEDYYKKLGFMRMDDMACLRDRYSKGLECLIIKIGNLIENYLTFSDPEYQNISKRIVEHNNWKLSKKQ